MSIVQVSQHPRAEHRASAELVVAKSVTITESETDCCIEIFFCICFTTLEW